MELDSFTENLLQRTQARRDYLNKKLSDINQLSARKRRTSDSDENRDAFEVIDANLIDDSPKRQCLETSSETEGNIGFADDVENKENLLAENDGSNVFVPIHTPGKTRGLAALKKSKPLGSEDNARHQTLKDEIMIGFEVPSKATYTSKIQSSTNLRFAALAADIRNWDDDSSNSSSGEVKTASCTRESTSVSSRVSSSPANSLCNSASSLVQHSEKTVSSQFTNSTSKHVDAAGSSNFDPLVNSQRTSDSLVHGECAYSLQKESKQKLKLDKEEQQESQGFVKSSSKLKLSYDYATKSKEPSDEMKLPPIRENSLGGVGGCMGSQQFTDLCGINKSSVVTVARPDLELKQCSKYVCSPAVGSASNITPIDNDKDPAELPLSSRRALFESAFGGGASKQIIGNNCESSLSVAQRAALFEKTAKQGNMLPINRIAQKDPIPTVNINASASSPMKIGVMADTNTIKRLAKPNFTTESRTTESSTKLDSPSKTAGSPAKIQTLTSPLKNIGPHTLLIQERLNSCPGWQDKEIVVKAKEERKGEIAALRSHWEKVSSSSADSIPESVSAIDPNQRNMTAVMSPLGEETSVFTVDESSSLEEMPEDASLVDSQHSRSISSELEWDDEMASEKNESGECADLMDDAAVCHEMDDDLLDEALDSQTKSSLPLSSPVKAQQKWQGSDAQISNCSSMDNFPSTPRPVNEVPVCSSEHNAKVPVLQYTVSTYRRQKQEAKTTPIRTIKREPSINPPSPKADNTVNIKEEIQVLHNEVLTQQNHISQTSQALNLCRATAEFSGSTEEVEGERLLLIATLKRQACLNEIQHLKTLHQEMVDERKGTLTINDIRLPLKRDFIASQLERNNDTVHYFLCSIRHHAQVVFTQMLSSDDGVSGGCLNFTNHINIHNLSADFSVAFEVYSLQRKKEVLSHEKKYHIKKDHSKLRLTPKGKKGDSKLLTPSVSSPGGPLAVRTPSFGMVGYTRFTLNNCDRKSCTLEKVPFISPLEGSLHFNVQLHAEHNMSMKGFLTMFEDVSGFGAWHRRWCVLDGGDLAFWKYPDEEKKKDPIGIIDFTHCVTAEVGLVSRDICARPHTFQLVTVRPHEKGDKNTLISRSVNTVTTTKHLLSADTKPERIVWCQKLNDALTNIRKWNPHALRPLEMKKK